MNSFLYTAMSLCLVASCALAQYQSAAQYGGNSQSGYQQRKMAPTPQTYGNSQPASSYGGGAQMESSGGYGGGEGYSRQQPAAAPSSSYGRQQSSGYGAQQAASYAKPAPAAKYEEPYHPPMPFAWGYDINDGYGGAQYHKENGDEYGKRTGSYGYTDAYGIYRQVDYVADENGFRATIKTNEPGTANESPADVELHAYEPPSNYYAGNQNSYGSSGSYNSGSSGSYGSASSSKAPTSSYGSAAASSQSSYGSAPAPASSSYGSAAPAPASSSYGSAPAPASSSYGQQQASYSPPAQRSYSQRNSGASSYGKQQQAYPSRSSSSSSSSYSEPSAQYSSSVIVPVFQKATAASLNLSAAPKALIAAAAPSKRY